MADADDQGAVSPRDLPAAVLGVVRESELSVAAAGIAYYAFNALLPTLVLAVLAASASGALGAAADAAAALLDVAPERVSVVASAIRDREGVGRLAALAGGIAAWSAFQLARAIAAVFAAVYGESERSRLAQTADAVVVFLTWVLALGVVLAGGVVLAYVEPAPVVAVGWPVVLFVVLFVVFLPTYLVFPESVSVREAVPGAALAAGAWTGSALVFRAYASTAASVRLFGVVGVVLLVLTWLYVGSFALVAGAAANAVLAGRVDTHVRG